MPESTMDVDLSGASVSDSEGCGGGSSSTHSSSQAAMSSGNKLKRSSSAPMINQLVLQGPVSNPPLTSASREGVLGDTQGTQPRVRRFSASFGPVSPLSPGSSRGSGPLRVCQLRVEEGMDVVNREAAHERTVQSTLQITDCLSQSWEDLTLPHTIPGSVPTSISTPISVSTNVNTNTSGATLNTTSIRRDFTDPLHLTIVPTVLPLTGCGASPTRGVGRQCFSPSLQQHVRNMSFCPSPSPTKKTFATRRSLSPIALRPSPLGAGLKRKWDVDDRCEPFVTPNKRMSSCAPDRCIGGLLITQPHSVGSLDNSPTPGGPGSLGSVGTPESVCSSESPGLSSQAYSPVEAGVHTPEAPPHLFKPVSPALSTEHTSAFGSQQENDRFVSQNHSSFDNRERNRSFSGPDLSEEFRSGVARDRFLTRDHNDRFSGQEHGGQYQDSCSPRSQFLPQVQNVGFSNQDHSSRREHYGPRGVASYDTETKSLDASDTSSSSD
ncbi:protein FAM122A-like, partial [Homarus americanus]